MFRIPAGTPVVLLAAMLGGCTITTGGPPPRGTSYSSPDRSPRPSANNRPNASNPRPNTPPAANPTPNDPTPNNPNRPSRGYTPAPIGGVVPQRANTPAPAASPSAPRVSASFLFGNGDNGAFRGLAYAVPQSTTRLPNLSGMTPFAQMFVDSFAISPRDFSGGFPGVTRQSEWFALRYDGRFAVRRQGNYTFRLVADDGAILYIDGDKVVDNDGVHASESRSGSRTLAAGVHSLRVDYLHTVGPVSLMVFLAVDGNESILVGER